MNGTSVRRGRRQLAAERDRELAMAREAIALVVRGASQRVSIAAIHHGHEIQRAAQTWADAQGASVIVTCDRPVSGHSDLTIELLHLTRDQAARR